MIISIDESGTHRQSGYSVIALICVASSDKLDKLDQALAEVLPYLMPERNIERLFIDGKKHKHYARTLKKVLRDKSITVKKLKTVNDNSYPSVRVADAVAGAVRYYVDNPNKEATKLYKAIAPKVEFIHLQK